jgi:hypothetical protein
MRLRSALIAAVASAAAIGCGLNQEGIAPPPDRIFYPGAILVEPDLSRWLFVLNSNSDLRFNDGTLVAVDLDLARAVYDKARPAGGAKPASDDKKDVCSMIGFINPISMPGTTCCWDALDHEVLDCDERQFVEKSATVRVGSFGSALARMKAIPEIPAMDGMVGRPARAPILLAGVRGNDSITWIEETAAPDSIALGCAPGSGPNAFVECDDVHRVTATTDPPGPTDISPTVLLPEEPYALAVDDAQELLYVGHLRNGYLSSVNLATSTPKLIGPFPGIFPVDINGSAGVTSLTLTAQGINSGRVYAASRFVPRAGAFAPISFGPTADPNQPSLTPIQIEAAKADDNKDSFLTNAGDVFVSPLPGSEIRGIQVIPEMHRTFLLQRTPPVLLGFDTTNPGNNVAADILEMCNGPTFLDVNPPYVPGDTRGNKMLFVTCFEAGEVYVVDPYVPQLVAIIEVGRGPSGLAFSPPAAPPAAPDAGARAYVVGFGSNNVSVIDLDSNSPTQYHVIQRIGFPNPVPR